MIKWYALGIDDPYSYRYGSNNTEVKLNFKNVAITDNEDIEKSSFVIWDRIYHDTEDSDIKRIKAILKAVQFL